MWLTFTLYGLVAAGAVWVLANRKLRPVVRVVLGGAVVLLALAVAYVTGGPTFLGDDPWYRRSPFQETLLFVFMALGMIARYMTNAIEERRRKIAAMGAVAGAKPGIEFDVWEFAYPLLVSVITFGLLLQQIGDEGLNLANSILSFQTGFFWQTLLARSQAQATG